MEEHSYQQLFNIAVMLAGGFGGYILRSVTETMKDLQGADMKLTEKVHNLETVVVGDYVHRDNLKEVVNVLFEKLDKIDAKLDRKTDKEFCSNFHKIGGQ